VRYSAVLQQLWNLMGVAVTGQHSASHNKQDGQQASSTFSPVHRRAVTGNAPSTPSGVVLAKAPKRLQHMAEDDDNGLFFARHMLLSHKFSPPLSSSSLLSACMLSRPARMVLLQCLNRKSCLNNIFLTLLCCLHQKAWMEAQTRTSCASMTSGVSRRNRSFS